MPKTVPVLPQVLSEMITWRRHLHAYPELSGNEYHTRDYIIRILKEIGISYSTFPDHAGVVGVIEGGAPGPVIALRADMDALPIAETNSVPYKSLNEGIMHACGHDGHMAILLGAASALQQSRNKWSGTVKLLFQPSEEAAPHGGAPLLIRDGVLDNPKVDAIFGLHLWPDIPHGTIGICRGPMMASSDRFALRMLGSGSHAATPHQGTDAIMMTADVLNGLSRIVHRRIDPREAATISVGTIHGGERYNVVAKEVTIEGTVRCLTDSTRQRIPEMIRDMAAGIAASYQGHYQLDYQFGYPSLRNSPEEASIVIMTASQFLKAENVIHEMKPVLGAEDFAYYTQQIPGAYFLLGCQKGNSEVRPLHNGNFDFDEWALFIGAQLMEEIAINALTVVGKRKEEEIV